LSEIEKFYSTQIVEMPLDLSEMYDWRSSERRAHQGD
jgi:hypothetical protein